MLVSTCSFFVRIMPEVNSVPFSPQENQGVGFGSSLGSQGTCWNTLPKNFGGMLLLHLMIFTSFSMPNSFLFFFVHSLHREFVCIFSVFVFIFRLAWDIQKTGRSGYFPSISQCSDINVFTRVCLFSGTPRESVQVAIWWVWDYQQCPRWHNFNLGFPERHRTDDS